MLSRPSLKNPGSAKVSQSYLNLVKSRLCSIRVRRSFERLKWGFYQDMAHFHQPEVTIVSKPAIAKFPWWRWRSQEHTVDDFRTYLATRRPQPSILRLFYALKWGFYQDMTHLLSTGRDYSRENLPPPCPHDVAEDAGEHNRRLPHLFGPYGSRSRRFCGHFECWSEVFIRTWFTSSAPEVPIAAITCLCHVPMM